jgi:hypothetical protein
MAKFIILWNILLTLSICQAADLAINGRSLRTLIGSVVHRGPLFQITLSSQNGDQTVGLRFTGNDLQASGSKGPLHLDVDAFENETPYARVPGGSLKLVGIFENQGGLIGDRTSNPIFIGTSFSLIFDQFFFFGARIGSASLIRGLQIEKLDEGLQYPLIQGIINFNQYWSGVFIPVDDSDLFVVTGGRVRLIIDVLPVI